MPGDIYVTPSPLAGVIVIDTDFFSDQRGFFIENWHRARFADHGLNFDFVQDNHSRSTKGVLRGLHWQDMREPMGKLVRCTQGAILDVAVDLRVGSPTFGKWFAVELSSVNMRQVMVPAGFGHAFLTLTETAEVQYKCTGFYNQAAEGTLAWNDPDVAIDWPSREPVLSHRDQNGIRLAEYLRNPAFIFGEGC